MSALDLEAIEAMVEGAHRARESETMPSSARAWAATYHEDVPKLIAALRKERDTTRALAEYTFHKPQCSTWRARPYDCSCGLADLLAGLQNEEPV